MDKTGILLKITFKGCSVFQNKISCFGFETTVSPHKEIGFPDDNPKAFESLL
jgi:hypothetical protein